MAGRAGEPLFTVPEIAEATGGTVEATGDRPVGAVSIDTRSATPNCLFVPLRGTRVDGHDFVPQALAAGAAVFLVSRELWMGSGETLAELARRHGAGVVAVEDTLRALQALAAWHLRRFPRLTRIGITGSNGKTTTKELLGAAISTARRTVASPGNLNSETGLPLSCFLVNGDTEVAVFEMAMNHIGEIADLAAIVRPDIGLVTNVGVAHIGFCGSREAIAREKRDIFRFYTGKESAFLPEQDRFYDLLAEGVKGRVVPFGPHSTRGFEKSEDRGLDGSLIHWEGLRIRLPLVGRHNVSNALAAISVASELGVPAAGIKTALEAARPLEGRAQILRGRVTVIADFYNSSPDSVRELLGLLGSLKSARRRIGVFGSMLELGEAGPAEHQTLGESVARAGLDAVCFMGAEARVAYEAAKRLTPGADLSWTDDHAELTERLRSTVRDGDLVVLKGSRGVELERVLPVLLPEEGRWS